MLAPASRLSFTRIYGQLFDLALTISDNFNKDIIMNISENATSVRPEVKDVATVLQQVKTTIQQRYPYTVVNLKVERKGVKTTITAYGIGMDKAVEAYVDTHDLLTKNGFAVYPLTKPALQSEAHAK